MMGKLVVLVSCFYDSWTHCWTIVVLHAFGLHHKQHLLFNP